MPAHRRIQLEHPLGATDAFSSGLPRLLDSSEHAQGLPAEDGALKVFLTNVRRAYEWSQRSLELYPDGMSALISAAYLHGKAGQKNRRSSDKASGGVDGKSRDCAGILPGLLRASAT